MLMVLESVARGIKIVASRGSRRYTEWDILVQKTIPEAHPIMLAAGVVTLTELPTAYPKRLHLAKIAAQAYAFQREFLLRFHLVYLLLVCPFLQSQQLLSRCLA